MSGFTTNELLYPLTKGDTEGHEFHGNQHTGGIGGGGSADPNRYQVSSDRYGSEQTAPRPTVGTYQLTPDEAKQINASIKEGKSNDQIAVMVSKMLGMDKPATKVETPPDRPPDLYRGSDRAGAESLTQPLEMYGKGGGAYMGSGVYATSDKDYAGKFSEDESDKVLVEMWVDPNARVMSWNDYRTLLKSDTNSHGSFDDHKPANLALLHGYQAYLDGDDSSMVILDRSILKVKY